MSTKEAITCENVHTVPCPKCGAYRLYCPREPIGGEADRTVFCRNCKVLESSLSEINATK